MTSEVAGSEPSADRPSPRRPWLGVLLSLFVPGFGIMRSGRVICGVAWFLSLQVGFLAVWFLLASQPVPFGLALVAAGCWVIAFVAMLCISYKPGRMSLKLWTALVGLLALSYAFGEAEQFVAQPFKMGTGSMRPTLQGERSGQPDHIFVDCLAYLFASPRRGDLMVFRTDGLPGLPQGQIYVKRIVGMPGELIEISDGVIVADGGRMTEKDGVPPIHYTRGYGPRADDGSLPESYEVPEGAYFVVGDDPEHSLDSRHCGCIPMSNVLGKATTIYYPLSRAGRLRSYGEPGAAPEPPSAGASRETSETMNPKPEGSARPRMNNFG